METWTLHTKMSLLRATGYVSGTGYVAGRAARMLSETAET